jgi:hypothetical protein
VGISIPNNFPIPSYPSELSPKVYNSPFSFIKPEKLSPHSIYTIFLN